MKKMDWRNRCWRALTVIVAWAAAIGIFFREFVSSGFARIQIRGGDADIGYFVAEHWYRWLHGEVPWLDPEYFHPVKGTLGFVDCQFLYAPPYVLFRALGADVFLSLQLVAVVLVSIGFFSVYVLLRRHLGVRVLFSLVAAFAFSCSNALARKQFHANTFGVEFVPLVVLLIAECLRSGWRGDRTRSAVFAGGAGFLWALLFFTSFYMAWMSMIVASTATIVGAVVGRRTLGAALRRARADWRTWAIVGASSIVAFGIGIVPFLISFLPVMRSSGGRPWSEVLRFLARPSDVFNLGHDNLLWGQVTWPGTTPLESVERALAVTPILVVGSVLGVALLWLMGGRVEHPRRRLGLTVLLVTAAIVTILTWRMGDRSLWKALWWTVPGGRAIRAVARIQFILALLYVVAWAGAMDEIWTAARRARRSMKVLGLGLIVLASVGVVVEQTNTAPLRGFDHNVRSNQIAALPDPPLACEAFYVIDSSGSVDPAQAQLAAMMATFDFGIPTLNGLSGMAPSGWNLYAPGDPRYPSAVQAWIDRYGLRTPVCGFDLATRRWVQAAPN